MKIRSVFVEYLLTPRPLICDFFFAFPYHQSLQQSIDAQVAPPPAYVSHVEHHPWNIGSNLGRFACILMV